MGNPTMNEGTGSTSATRMRTLVIVAALIGSVLAATLTILGAPLASTASLTTLGNQERQDISAPNQWVEGNIDFWLESHLYDAEIRLDAGSSAAAVPSTVDVGMSFFFAEQNAIEIDWTQDWYVTLKSSVMFYSRPSVPPSGGFFQCSTPPNIVSIPVNGRSIQVPQAGSICISDVNANGSPNPNTGWTSLMSLPLSDLNKVLPKRNEPCSSQSGGLCVSGPETEASPTMEHYFRVSFVDLFGPSGKYPQSWWPNLPAGQSLALYWRNHLALTAVWKTAIGASGGGSQPEFCMSTGPGAIRNTNYNRCSWTTVSREGAGGAQGSKNHGDVFAPGIGQKTIPLPQVVAPTGFITACKIVTNSESDRSGAFGTLTNGWTVHVDGPFGTSMTKTTGSDGTGCSRFGPLFPATDYAVSEVVQLPYAHIGTLVVPSSDRRPGFGANPDPYNPVNVSLTFTEAQSGIGPVVTFVNFRVQAGLTQSCSVQIFDASGAPVSRDYAIAGDTVVFTYVVTNTGNVVLTVVQTHTNTARLGPNPIFSGSLGVGASLASTRSTGIVKGDLGPISDTASASGVDRFGDHVFAADSTCSFICRAPSITFEKHPVLSDNAATVPGAKVTYTIVVRNTGDAPAVVIVTDALGAGQTFLNGGADTGPGDLPSPAATSPAGGADYPAPVTVTWSALSLGAGATLTITFRVKVTTTVDNSAITGTMTLTAANANGVDYSPNPNTAQNFVRVHRPILKLSQLGYTNSPNGTPTQGVVNGTTIYTISFTNYGSAVATLSGTFTITVTGAGAGAYQCYGAGVSGCVLTFSGVTVNSGDTVTFTVRLEYQNMATGAVVDGSLSATYTTPPSAQTYLPSGCPALIEFTIQGG